MQNEVKILSTKLVDDSLVSTAAMYHILIEQVPFINTEEIVSPWIKERIGELSKQKLTVIFTSTTAVNAVNKMLTTRPSWKIFCTAPATRQLVESVFGNKSIAGSAENADALSNEIIAAGSAKETIFFCGDQRRNVLRERLREKGIAVEELVVYKTVGRPQIISKKYDAILFFSPSAVKSFFSVNTIPGKTQIFAIGSTTANEVKLFSNLPVVIAEYPETRQLIWQAIKHFSTPTTFPCSN